MYTENMLQAQTRFTQKGYAGRAQGEAGSIRFLNDGGLYLPEQVVVEDLCRHESSGPEGGVTFAIYSPKSAQRATLSLDCGSHNHALAARLMAGQS